MKILKIALKDEWAFFFGAATTLVFYVFADALLGDVAVGPVPVLLFLWLFATMLWCSFAVVRHADALAHQLGEPYGTLILTLAVISIEVSLIASIMLLGENEPTLARDTMFAVLMIVLNALVGIALLLGGLRHREQNYNLQGAKAFLAVLVPLSVISLLLPNFTRSTDTATFTPGQEVVVAVVTIVLYAVFLSIQTVRHRNLFVQPGKGSKGSGAEHHVMGSHQEEVRSVAYHASFLVLTMLPVVMLAKKFAVFIDFGIESLDAPVAVGGLIIAIIVLTPEGLSALGAALSNQLQRSVNILLGSALATIGLTIPAVLTISLVIDRAVVLGLSGVEMVLLVLTLAVSVLSFTGGRTNILHGAVHLVLFLIYVMLIFSP